MASLTRRVPVALPTLAGVHDTQRPDNGGVAGAAYWENLFGTQLLGPFTAGAVIPLTPPGTLCNPL